MVLIQNLHKAKDYKEDTLFLAGSLADRFLASLSSKGLPAPDTLLLATTCILLGAKLEQPMSPSFLRMINLLPEGVREGVTKEKLIRLEERIIKELKFFMHFAGPIPFL